MGPPAEMGGVNLPPAWDITTGSTGIVVAVIDTGSLPAHPDLAGRFMGGYDFISDSQVGNDGNGRDADPSDPGDWITAAESGNPQGTFAGCPIGSSTFHGSHVAGTIGAASGNGSGVAGINWVSKILPLRVLGKCGGYTSDIADAIVVRGRFGSGSPCQPQYGARAQRVWAAMGLRPDAAEFDQCCARCQCRRRVVAGNSGADASQTPRKLQRRHHGRRHRTCGDARATRVGALVEIWHPAVPTVECAVHSQQRRHVPNKGYNCVLYQGTNMATPFPASPR